MSERRILGLVALLMAVLTGLAGTEPPALPAAALRQEAAAVLAGKGVVLDPGHGGPDGGAVGRSGSVEKAITLDVALRLRDLLTQAGARTLLTREDDRDLAGAATRSLRQRKREDLTARTALGNDSGADVFLSIHANSFPSLPAMHGAQTFYLASASSENRRLATALQDELVRLTGNTDREPNQRIDQYLLENLKIPAVTVEVGFLSNPREEQLLLTPEYRQQVAWSLFVGLVRYFQMGALPARARPAP